MPSCHVPESIISLDVHAEVLSFWQGMFSWVKILFLGCEGYQEPPRDIV